ncbi:hypothetical protein JZ751_020824 [Albula glossodonta]|uniref:Uncharacterized protein n=1 Tax=Albula glossodonta TaxID=121402 RepID=A0A8T2PJM6_9TELE|nr:hypothetical protein JZ751_020824 [Albula glossodonta]
MKAASELTESPALLWQWAVALLACDTATIFYGGAKCMSVPCLRAGRRGWGKKKKGVMKCCSRESERERESMCICMSEREKERVRDRPPTTHPFLWKDIATVLAHFSAKASRIERSSRISPEGSRSPETRNEEGGLMLEWFSALSKGLAAKPLF